MSASFRLRDLPVAMRLGLTGVLATLLLGLAASVAHLEEHHQNRDGRPGVSLADLEGAYHGLDEPARLVTALERGHPADLKAEERTLLLAWLAGKRVSEDFDNPDLGSAAPAEVLQRSCVSCHARNSSDGLASALPLEYWNEIESLAFGRKLDALPLAILTTSTHTHALSLALISLAVGALLFATRLPNMFKGVLCATLGIALACDFAGQWLARSNAALLWLVIVGGAAWAGAVTLSALATLVDLWWPRRR